MKFLIAALTTIALSVPAFADVNVTGNGSVEVTPDVAVLSIHVTARAENSGDAFKTTETQAKQVFALATKLKVANGDVCTHSFAVNPAYEYNAANRPEQKFVGYDANTNISVTFRDMSAAGAALGEFSKINGVRIQGIHFGVSDALRESVIEKARKKAMENARARAQLYANAEGLKLWTVKEIQEQEVYSPRYDSMRQADVGRESAVAAGTSKVSVTVRVTYTMTEDKGPNPR